jgi:enoyl-CoA hydratase
MIEHLEHRGARVVRMAHGKASALDIEFCAALTDELEKLEREGAPGFVLTGSGAIFSAGVDLLRASRDGGEYLRRFLPVLSRCFEALFFYPGPVVTAVNGHAIAGGCILACAGDRRLLVRSVGGKPAMIGVPELAVGVPFPSIALETMRHVATARQFQDLIYGAETFHGDEAIARGLADELVDEAALLDTAARALAKLQSIPRLTFETTKRELRLPARERCRAIAAEYDATVIEAWASPQTLESLRAYVGRTLKK